MSSLYIILAILWIGLSVFLGLYITGVGLSHRVHYLLGIRAIVAMYLLGICLLFAAVALT